MNQRFKTDGEKVWTNFQPRAEHIGFRETVHGGIIATLLDEMMVWACAVRTKRFAFCAELNVRFAQSLRPNQTAIASAELVTNRKDRLFEARAEVRTEAGEVLATATGKYLPIKTEDVTEMASDFVGDPKLVFE